MTGCAYRYSEAMAVQTLYVRQAHADLYDRARKTASEKGVSLSELVAAALSAYLPPAAKTSRKRA